MSAKKIELALVVAMANNRVIGQKNSLPWHLPVDLKRFRSLTLGHPIVMGRKTFDSIGRVLPGRTSIVVTRDKNWHFDEVLCVSSVEEAVELGQKIALRDGVASVMIVGGAEMYRQCISRADRLFVTEIHTRVDGDAFFPEIDSDCWDELERHDVEPESPEFPACSFVEYRRSRE